MKFLIADDVPELREILKMDVESNYQVEIHEAIDGQAAIDLILKEGPFDLVISDYNMPQKNGADVLKELRKSNSNTPFLLVSTHADVFDSIFVNDPYVATLSKPYKDEEFTAGIEKLLSQNSLLAQKESHLPIKIEILEKIIFPGVSLYIRLGDGQFIKVLKAESHFTKEEANKYRKKNLTHLYVELIDIKSLLTNFRKGVFANLEWESIDTNVAVANLESEWSLILDTARNFGWPESIKKLAKENVARTLSVVKKNPALAQLWQNLKISGNKSQVAPHCYFLVLLMTSILKELGWDSESTLKKITFAALLHDMELNDDAFSIKLQRLSELGFGTTTKNKNDEAINNHPIAAAQLVSFWTSCPPDVDKLILQHHERFDGTGFPNQMTFLNIFPLSGVMIIAEDIIYQSLLNEDLNLFDFLKSKQEYYSRGEFKKVYEAALKVLETYYQK